jgi:short-subunit dehydrogenase
MTRRSAADFRHQYGPWALVSGSVEGLGACYADSLAAAGLQLALLDRNAGGLAKQAADLRRRHPQLQVRELVADLTESSQLHVALDALADIEVGLLVANAAYSVVGRWLDVSLADKLRHVEVNCAAVVTMLDRLSRAMVDRGRGGVIVMSSLAGQQGSARVATYAATKAFDLVLAESLWAELREHGVDVLAVLPGSTRTPGFESSLTPGVRLPKAVHIMEPDDVVREALAALGKRPSHIAGARNRATNVLLQRVLPRRRTIELMARSTTFLRSAPPS